jgi:hypothetical protein
VEGMLLGATGGETRATGAVAQQIGALQPDSLVAMAAGRRYPPMGILDLAALGPATGTT